MSQSQRRAAITGVLSFVLAAFFGLSQVVAVSQNPAPVAAPPAALLTVPDMHSMPHTPRSKQPAAVPDAMKCARPVGSVRTYYADYPNKESKHSDGPPLINMNLSATEMVKPNTVDQTISSFWNRLCTDPAFAAKTAAGYDPKGGNPNAILTDFTWSGALDFIRSQGGWSYAKGARLVYEAAPKGSWTDYMIPGHGKAPHVGYDKYPHGASWFLKVPSTDKSGPQPYRIKCGGQWVGPKSRIPVAYHN